MRNWVIPVIAILALGLLAAGYYGYTQYNAKQQLEIAVANGYRQAFYGLLDNMKNVQVKLAKSLVSNTLEQNLINLSDVWREAEAAQANLGQLPLSPGALMRTEQFLAQAGDFAFSLLRKNAMGIVLSEKERKKLAELRDQADELGSALQGIQADVNNGKLSWTELHRTANPRLRTRSKEVKNVGFADIEKQMNEYPTLVYDGPFSDHVMDQKPKGLTGPDITEDEAQQRALKFVPKQTAPPNPTAVKVGEVRGKIPAWTIEIRDRQGRDQDNQKSNIALDISKKGGHVVNMVVNREIGDAKISVEEAVAKAKDFLTERGFNNMVPTYVQFPDNIAVIPFAREQNDIIIYPDQVKVKVALDNGEILGFDALQYIMHHHKRDLPKPKISKEEARQAVSPGIDILDSSLAVIPLETGKEAFCWEFKGQTDGGEPFVFYIDTATGDVVNILKIIENEEGQTAM